MGAHYNVLIVEPDAGFRLALSASLSRHSATDVLARAGGLETAVLQLNTRAPNVLLLSDQLLDESALEVIQLMRKEYTNLQLIVIGNKRPPLNLGTSCPRPEGDRSVIEQWFLASLLPVMERNRIKHPVRAAPHLVPRAAKLAPPQRGASTQPLEVIALAASTGGPDALMVVLRSLPADLEVPVVIVQHMPASFSEIFVEQLDKCCALKVQLAREGQPIAPGEIWLAPGDHHLEVRRSSQGLVLSISDGPLEHGCRPAVDPLFRSLAAIAAPTTLAAVLTGMGSDGGPGSRMLVDAGGVVFAQDEPTSVVWGMPAAVVKLGAADKVLPLQEIGPALCEHLKSRRRAA